MIGYVDGDGRNDLLAIEDTSSAHLFTYLAANPLQTIEDATSVGDYGVDSYAYDAVNLGDLDGDGREETFLPIGQDGTSGGSFAVIWSGDLVTFGSERNVEDASLRAASTQQMEGWGYRVAMSPDVDGDGAEEFITGG